MDALHTGGVKNLFFMGSRPNSAGYCGKGGKDKGKRFQMGLPYYGADAEKKVCLQPGGRLWAVFRAGALKQAFKARRLTITFIILIL
jgi:hypothetical protein